MVHTRRILARLSLVVIVLLGLAGAAAPRAQTAGRVLYMAAVEMKGGTQQEREPYPAAPLPAGGGYVKTPPTASGRWEVSAYQWSPGTLVVQLGEPVTLEIVTSTATSIHPRSPGWSSRSWSSGARSRG